MKEKKIVIHMFIFGSQREQQKFKNNNIFIGGIFRHKVLDFVLLVPGRIFRHKVKRISFMLLDEFIGGIFPQ
jgi:hypothetical protein